MVTIPLHGHPLTLVQHYETERLDPKRADPWPRSRKQRAIRVPNTRPQISKPAIHDVFHEIPGLAGLKRGCEIAILPLRPISQVATLV